MAWWIIRGITALSAAALTLVAASAGTNALTADDRRDEDERRGW